MQSFTAKQVLDKYNEIMTREFSIAEEAILENRNVPMVDPSTYWVLMGRITEFETWMEKESE